MVQEKEEKLWRIMLMRMLRNDGEEYQNEREKRLLTYAYPTTPPHIIHTIITQRK